MSELEKLKKQYAVLQKKYKLPGFSELNVDFEIEKLQDKETEHLLRGVRRTMIEKIANVVRFLEVLINPSETPTPMFVFAMMKNISSETKKAILNLYKELSSIEVSALALDISHDEKEEAQFINEVFKLWSSHKPELKEITKKLSIMGKKERSERGYLG